MAFVHAGLPPAGGVSLTGALAATAVRVVLATGDTVPLRAALRAGVRVIMDPHCLGRALAAAERGDVLGRRAALQLGTIAARPEPLFAALSAREFEVLRLMTFYTDPARMASRLGLAVKTVRKPRARILVKTGAPDREAAARLARTAGLGAAPR